MSMWPQLLPPSLFTLYHPFLNITVLIIIERETERDRGRKERSSPSRAEGWPQQRSQQPPHPVIHVAMFTGLLQKPDTVGAGTQRGSSSALRHRQASRGPYRENMLNMWVLNQTGGGEELDSEVQQNYSLSLSLSRYLCLAPCHQEDTQILCRQTRCPFRKQLYKKRCRGMGTGTEQSGRQAAHLQAAIQPFLLPLHIPSKTWQVWVTTPRIAPFLNSRPLYTLFPCPSLPSCHCTLPMWQTSLKWMRW